MWMNIRLVGKFIMWCLRGFLSRIIGSKSFIGTFWRMCKHEFEEGDPMLVLIIAVGTIMSGLISGIFSGVCGHTEPEVLYAMLISCCMYLTFVLSAGVSVLWDRFIEEYEQTFTILKEKHDV